jgi:signal transduction histidine kinase
MENQQKPSPQEFLTPGINIQESIETAILDKEIAEGKFEIASDTLHDIGNAMVGFGSWLARIRRSLEQNNLENLQNLAGFFAGQHAAMAVTIGEAKSGAVVSMLNGMVEAQKASEEEIQKSITEQLHLITHIQEILAIQRQYSIGNESKEKKASNLRTIINDCISMLLASIDKRAILISLDLRVDSPVIMGDRTQLMQVVLNILKNSMEAIPLNATEKTISIRLHTKDGLLILAVQDNGSGFDEETAGQLFERGFSTKSSGTGLGLNNCRTIVESHAGTIDITSNGIGKGALTMIKFKAA